jgi:hypothetical protein
VCDVKVDEVSDADVAPEEAGLRAFPLRLSLLPGQRYTTFHIPLLKSLQYNKRIEGIRNEAEKCFEFVGNTLLSSFSTVLRSSSETVFNAGQIVDAPQSFITNSR